MSCGMARPDEVARLRHEVVAYVEELRAPEPVTDGVRLAVSEALTNVVLHAYLGRDPGPAVAEAWFDADHLLVRVCDEGQGLVPRVDSRRPRDWNPVDGERGGRLPHQQP